MIRIIRLEKLEEKLSFLFPHQIHFRILLIHVQD
jgi:hypothetical protein